MPGKLALAFSAPLLLSNSQPSEPVYADIDGVRQVLCSDTRGTAFRTGSRAFVTAWHVAANRGCTIDGEPINITHVDKAHDIAFLRTETSGEVLPVDCGGYTDKAGYAGVGYARGRPVQQVIFVLFAKDVDASLPKWGGFSTLFGDRFIPGMSGGPVFNSAGKVVGIVNGFNSAAPLSYSQSLSETALCQDSASARP